MLMTTQQPAELTKPSVGSLHNPASLPAEDLDRRPVPSTSCPCPAWFYRPRGPLFRRGEAAVQEGLVPFQQALFIESPQQGTPCLQPDAFLFPLLQPPPAGRGRRKLVGQEPPGGTGLQNPQNAFQTGPVQRPRSAPVVPPTLWFGK